MYNYRIKKITEQEILEGLYNFCNEEHNEEELMRYLREALSNLFELHECSLFNKPLNLCDSTWHRILYEVNKWVEKNNIKFPERRGVGPRYHKSKNDDISWVNDDKRLSKLMPHFFGVPYIDYSSGTFSKEDAINNLKEGRKANPVLKEKRKLYDILYSLCHPDNAEDTYTSNENKKLEKDIPESSNIIGNLAKPSIFRFDHRAVGTYSEAFDHIRKELIYSMPGSDTWSRIRDALFLEKNTSQMRSFSFSLVEMLVQAKIKKSGKTMSLEECHNFIYDYIIKKCEDIYECTIKESGKKDKKLVPINMNIGDSDAIIYYAYLYFNHLPTSDYIHELQELFSSEKDNIDNVLRHYKEYCKNMDNTILQGEFLVVDNDYLDNDGFIPYNKVEMFLDNNCDKIMKSICTDDYTVSYKKYKKYILTFLRLFNAIYYRTNNGRISAEHLMKILRLYITLKRLKVSIPTASSGYKKKNASKPVQIDTAMKLLEEEWKLRDEDKSVPDDLYMRNTIIEAWISVVMYMVINSISRRLMKKRLEATEKLFHKLIQKIPPISMANEKPVNPDPIIEKFWI